jgi:transcription initiation factor TFIIIB Brf1 subunit/transcription initiation factor TFIIB
LISKVGIKVDVGKGPTGIATAELYVAVIMNESKVISRELARAAGVTEVNVRNRFGGLNRSLNLGLR